MEYSKGVSYTYLHTWLLTIRRSVTAVKFISQQLSKVAKTGQNTEKFNQYTR